MNKTQSTVMHLPTMWDGPSYKLDHWRCDSCGMAPVEIRKLDHWRCTGCGMEPIEISRY
jgi:ribosomal protein L37AE/L43A